MPNEKDTHMVLQKGISPYSDILHRFKRNQLKKSKIFPIYSNYSDSNHLLSHPYSAAIQLPLRLSHERIGGKAD